MANVYFNICETVLTLTIAWIFLGAMLGKAGIRRIWIDFLTGIAAIALWLSIIAVIIGCIWMN